MATCELKGELKNRDGHTNKFTVQVDANLKSIVSGIKTLNADISRVLTVLVEQEKGSGRNGKGLDNEVDEEEDSDEETANETATRQLNSEPPNKRKKSSRR
ncbi:hypothetical protein DNTS_023917 [Danionella cerebrum]|uniref:Uncharacterized protein n=1 Tax=Danionella cerebrum TaxID=2873325 RepID=A0A553MUY2_9TELE|nr:hypothetical protein DNTS_023917 [Danionella translucida]